MSVEGQELFLTQAHWDEGVAWETQNGEKTRSACRDCQTTNLGWSWSSNVRDVM